MPRAMKPDDDFQKHCDDNKNSQGCFDNVFP